MVSFYMRFFIDPLIALVFLSKLSWDFLFVTTVWWADSWFQQCLGEFNNNLRLFIRILAALSGPPTRC